MHKVGKIYTSALIGWEGVTPSKLSKIEHHTPKCQHFFYFMEIILVAPLCDQDDEYNRFQASNNISWTHFWERSNPTPKKSQNYIGHL